MKIFSRLIISSAIVLSFSANAIAAAQPKAKPSWNVWVKEVKREAVSEGIDPYLFDDVFRNIKQPNRRVIHFDRTQPEKRLTFLKYRKTRIDAFRIRLGASKYRKNRVLLENIGRDYGVNPCFITALWGIESSYGHFKGSFPVVKSLATLAYDGRRGAFFKKELLLALHILNGGHVSNANFKGEWAGASGHPQFLPSSWHKFAVDYNADGRKDIWNNYGDVFASVANYLKQNGWKTGEPWSAEIKLPKHFSKALVGYKVKKPVHEWIKLGVKPAYGFHLPKNRDLMASILTPYGGPSFMIFNNFRVLLRYNNSTYYAGSVGYLADKICKKIHRKKGVFANKPKRRS